ncbi:MAG: ATP-binding cassette domain-containing protein, partial [Gaiellales bacterium]
MTALLQARDVRRTFTRGGLFGRTHLRAVDGVDLDVRQGEVLALVGESGCGKTTLGRLLLGLDRPDEGAVELDGHALAALDRKTVRRRLQPIFQDPYASLDPRWTVARTVREALDAQRVGSRAERRTRVEELLSSVGFEPRLASSLPHELSGGQRQRVAI